jgi:hypothetical protein
VTVVGDDVTEPELPRTSAVPFATAVTTPVLLTVAIAVLDEDQVTAALAIVFPFWSFTVAVSCCVPPIASRAGLDGVIVTVVATGVGGPVPLSPPPLHPISEASAPIEISHDTRIGPRYVPATPLGARLPKTRSRVD